jgi:molybdate transport system substrate-binding protein
MCVLSTITKGHFLKQLLVCCLLLAFFVAPAGAQDEPLVLASGGGYKKMVNALVTAYTAKTGRTVDRMYGNMSRVTALGRTSGRVDVVLGAQAFLTGAGLKMTQVYLLGRGRLVIAWAGSNVFHSPQDLCHPSVTRIAVPDMHQAIYGKAAREYLYSTGVYDQIKDKLVEVATVPQVFSYLATNEVDFGFLNLTHALNVADKLGGYVPLDETMYKPIKIVLVQLYNAPHKAAAADFYTFLASDEAQKIIAANGL